MKRNERIQRGGNEVRQKKIQMGTRVPRKFKSFLQNEGNRGLFHLIADQNGPMDSGLYVSATVNIMAESAQ